MANLCWASRRKITKLHHEKPGCDATRRDAAGQGRPIDEEAAVGFGSYESWSECADMLESRDRNIVNMWADQAEGLVTFAALFSSVVTSFIIDGYTSLQPDPKTITVDLLRQIAAHLNGTALTDAASPTDVPFKPANSDVARNSLLLASLICSLLAAGMGIFYKEWVRQYSRGLPSDPRTLVRVRQLRYVGMHQTWKMQAIISGISIFLQLGVALFILALALFASSLHPVVSLVLNLFVVVWVTFWFGTAFCPLFSENCPFKSPLSRFIFTIVAVAKCALRKAIPCFLRKAWREDPPQTLEEQERDWVEEHGNALEREALGDLLQGSWEVARLANLEPCIEGLPRSVATTLIENLLATRRGPHFSCKEAAAEGSTVADRHIIRLAKLWQRVQQGTDEPPSVPLLPTSATSPNPPVNAMPTSTGAAPDRNEALVVVQIAAAPPNQPGSHVARPVVDHGVATITAGT